MALHRFPADKRSQLSSSPSSYSMIYYYCYPLQTIILYIIISLVLVTAQDDFGTGDYSDNTPPRPGTVEPDYEPGPSFEPDNENDGEDTGGGNGGSGNGGGGNNNPGFDFFPTTRPSFPGFPAPTQRPRFPGFPGPTQRPSFPEFPDSTQPSLFPTYPRPPIPRPPQSPPEITPPEGDIVGWREDTLWSRLSDFLNNFYNDYDTNVNNSNNNGNVVSFVTSRLGQFVDLFRYRGQDNHDHFYHCTQLIAGCQIPVFRNRTAENNTTVNNNNNPFISTNREPREVSNSTNLPETADAKSSVQIKNNSTKDAIVDKSTSKSTNNKKNGSKMIRIFGKNKNKK